MRMMRKLFGNLWVLSVMVLSPCQDARASEASNPVINGHFSAENTSFSSDANFVADPGVMHFGDYSVRSDPSSANGAWCGEDHTTGSGMFLICDGFSGSQTVAWRQTVSVNPGETYVYSAWVMNLVCGQFIADPIIELRADGTVVAGPLALPEAPEQWILMSGQYTPSGSTTTLEIVSTSTAGNGNDFGLDDISLVASGAILDGNVNEGAGPITDVLRVNGQTGSMKIGTGNDITVSLDSPPAGGSDYVLLVWQGMCANPLTLNVGTSIIGTIVNPAPVHPFASPQPVRCARSGLRPQLGAFCSGVPELGSAPSTLPFSLTKRGGFSLPTSLTLQAILEDQGALSSDGYSMSNVIFLEIE